MYLQSIKSHLSRFSQLQRLSINCIDYWEMGNVTCNLDEDFNTVTEWGETCPTLTEITLPRALFIIEYEGSLNECLFYRL